MVVRAPETTTETDANGGRTDGRNRDVMWPCAATPRHLLQTKEVTKLSEQRKLGARASRNLSHDSLMHTRRGHLAPPLDLLRFFQFRSLFYTLASRLEMQLRRRKKMKRTRVK